MVGSLRSFMILSSATPKREAAGVHTALFSLSSSFAFAAFAVFSFSSFGSCCRGWYYRCIGVDPWVRLRLLLSLPFSHRTLIFFFFCNLKKLKRWLIGSGLLFQPQIHIMSILPLQKSRKQAKSGGGSRFLISVSVLGSAGPLRFLVNEEELVAAVIDTTLRSYAREGRLPVLGSDLNNFLLYSANAGCDALSPWQQIGSAHGSRNFLLCRKQQQEMTPADDGTSTRAPALLGRKGSGSWKAWLNKSLNLKIPSHWLGSVAELKGG